MSFSLCLWSLSTAETAWRGLLEFDMKPEITYAFCSKYWTVLFTIAQIDFSLEWVTVSQCFPVHPWKGMSENWGYFLLAEAEKIIHWNPTSSNIQFLNHTEMYIKILKIQTYHNEHGWKYLQVSYMKNYHHHRFHICLSLPWNSKHDHSLLATKNIMLCHSAQ